VINIYLQLFDRSIIGGTSDARSISSVCSICVVDDDNFCSVKFLSSCSFSRSNLCKRYSFSNCSRIANGKQISDFEY